MLAAAPARALSGDVAAPRFDVLHIVVDGNTVLKSAVIEAAVYPFMGPGRSAEDIESARQALEAAFHKAGYETVSVEASAAPEGGDGVLHLRATEGRIDRLRVSGPRYTSLNTVKAALPALSPGEVPRMPEVQKQLEQLRAASADREITPILRAGRTPGMVEAELRVKDRLPLHGGVEINNRNSVNTSSTRLIGSLRYDNLWQRYHSASLQYQAAPEKQDVEVWAGTYVLPVLDEWRLALYGVGVDSTSPINNAGALAVIGNGMIFGARLVRPLPTRSNYSHNLSLGVDYKDFSQNVLRVGADDDNTPISYLPFLVRYEGVWRQADESSTRVASEINFSVRGVGNSHREFSAKRFAARANYFFFVVEAEHLEVLPYDVRVRGRITGQLADSPLISNEQFSAGGLENVRGYHETEVLGDDGVFVSLELQSPPWSPAAALGPLRIASFIDGAHLSVKEALPGTDDEIDLAAAGLGLHWALLRSLSADLDWAYPLFSVESVRAGDQRIHFKVAYEF